MGNTTAWVLVYARVWIRWYHSYPLPFITVVVMKGAWGLPSKDYVITSGTISDPLSSTFKSRIKVVVVVQPKRYSWFTAWVMTLKSLLDWHVRS